VWTSKVVSATLINFADVNNRLATRRGRKALERRQGYPTMARQFLNAEDPIEVDTYTCEFEDKDFSLGVTDQPGLDAWLNSRVPGR